MKKIFYRSHDPLKRPFVLDSKLLLKSTRKPTVKNWNEFFNELEIVFKRGMNPVGRGNTIERLQRESLFPDMLMWLRHLVAGRDFNRGDARAIEELMMRFSWYVIAEAEKFRDRYRFWEAKAHMTTKWRLNATEHLRARFPGKEFDPMSLNKLPEKYKKVGRAFIRTRYKNPLKVGWLVKEIFSRDLSRDLSSDRESAEFVFRVISKKSPYTP